MTEPAHLEYAGFVSRAVAFLVDVFLVAVIATGGLVVVQLFGAVLGGQVQELLRGVVRGLVVALPALFALYNTAFWALAGRTPGMALVGVRVVTTGGRDVSWLSALIRAVVLGFFPIGALWCLIDRRHQAVHDKLARTTVVRVAPVPAHATVVRGGSAGMPTARPRPSG
jgi:uncharacterized RDD family membrane protein YckC